jgi:hypothetical protein
MGASTPVFQMAVLKKFSLSRVEEKSEINLQWSVPTQIGQPEGQMRLLVREVTTHLQAGSLQEKETGRQFFVVIAKTTLEMGTVIEKP